MMVDYFYSLELRGKRGGKVRLADCTQKWYNATGALPWGTQRVLIDALTLVREGKMVMTYSADYSGEGNNPCLINTVGAMLKATEGKSGHGLPTQHFPDIVSAFDCINRELDRNKHRGIKYQREVQPNVAHYLLINFGKLQSVPDAENTNFNESVEYIQLREDSEILEDWFKSGLIPAPTEETVTGRMPLDKPSLVEQEYVMKNSTE